MSEVELKPCPFCGDAPVTKTWEVGGHEQIKIICDSNICNIHPSIFGNKETMMEQWNTRAEPESKVTAEEAAVK